MQLRVDVRVCACVHTYVFLSPYLYVEEHKYFFILLVFTFIVGEVIA